MPHHANATSYGGIEGNQPKPNGPTPDTFKRRMRLIADRAAEAKRWERMTAETATNDDFFKAFDRAADRGYGKPAQELDVTGQGALVIRIERVGEPVGEPAVTPSALPAWHPALLPDWPGTGDTEQGP